MSDIQTPEDACRQVLEDSHRHGHVRPDTLNAIERVLDEDETFDPDEELDTSGTPIEDPEHPVNQPKPGWRPASK